MTHTKSTPMNFLTMSATIVAFTLSLPVEEVEYYQEMAENHGIDPDHAAQCQHEAQYCE